jgi:hypothetical protein
MILIIGAGTAGLEMVARAGVFLARFDTSGQ